MEYVYPTGILMDIQTMKMRYSWTSKNLNQNAKNQDHTLHLSGTTESLAFCCCEHLSAPPNPPLLSPLSLSISSVYSLCIYYNMAVCPEFTSAQVPMTLFASSLIFCDQNVQVANPRLLNMTEFCFSIPFAPC